MGVLTACASTCLSCRVQVVKASQPKMPAGGAAAVAAPPPAGPPSGTGEEEGARGGSGRQRGGARRQQQQQQQADDQQPMSPISPSAADAAVAALAAAADSSGRELSMCGRELVPLPDQLQAAVDAVMASGGWAGGMGCPQPGPASICFPNSD